MAQITLNSSGVASSGSLLLQTNGTTTQATVDTSGNLGLGVTSPLSKLHLNDSTGTAVNLIRMQTAWSNPSGNKSIVWADGTDVLGRISVSYSSPTAKMTFGSLYSSGYQTGDLMTLDASGNLGLGATTITSLGSGYQTTQLQGANGSGLLFYRGSSTQIGYLYGDSTGMTWATGSAIPLMFLTNNTERARIDSSGNLLVGTTSAGTDKVRFASAGGTANQLGLVSTDDSSGNGFIQFRNSATTSIGSVSRVGTTNAVVYNTTSDYRLKTVIGAVSGAKERINALNPIEYYWTDGGQQARGFLAHEFKEVYANSVTGEKDAVDGEGNPVYQAMQASTPEVMADMVAYIQELETRLAALENK